MQIFEKEQLFQEKLQHVALQQNAELRSKFISDCSVYTREMLVFIDETGSDRRNSICKFGYGLVGKRASSTSLLVRGVRYSAIAILTTEGIQDRYITSGNVNAQNLMFEDFVSTPHAL